MAPGHAKLQVIDGLAGEVELVAHVLKQLNAFIIIPAGRVKIVENVFFPVLPCHPAGHAEGVGQGKQGAGEPA